MQSILASGLIPALQIKELKMSIGIAIWSTALLVVTGEQIAARTAIARAM